LTGSPIDEALLLESGVLALSKPEKRTLRAFKRWFSSSGVPELWGQDEDVPVLWGRDQDLFKDERDLVALAPVESDRLNEFLRKYFGWFLKVRYGM
jgi:hypothetical protein